MKKNLIKGLAVALILPTAFMFGGCGSAVDNKASVDTSGDYEATTTETNLASYLAKETTKTDMSSYKMSVVTKITNGKSSVTTESTTIVILDAEKHTVKSAMAKAKVTEEDKKDMGDNDDTIILNKDLIAYIDGDKAYYEGPNMLSKDHENGKFVLDEITKYSVMRIMGYGQYDISMVSSLVSDIKTSDVIKRAESGKTVKFSIAEADKDPYVYMIFEDGKLVGVQMEETGIEGTEKTEISVIFQAFDGELTLPDFTDFKAMK